MGKSRGLRRSREDRWIAGVCGGIAEHYGWSPNVVRFLYAVISILSTAFPGTLFYLLLCVLVPAAEPAAGAERADDDGVADVELEASHLSRTAALALAVLLGVLGAHRFYAGKVFTGLLMALTLGGLGIWWLVDIVLISTAEFRDSEGRRLVYWEGDEDSEYDALYDRHADLLHVRTSGVDSPDGPAPEWAGEGTWPASRQSTSERVGSSSSMIPTTSQPARSSSSS